MGIYYSMSNSDPGQRQAAEAPRNFPPNHYTCQAGSRGMNILRTTTSFSRFPLDVPQGLTQTTALHFGRHCDTCSQLERTVPMCLKFFRKWDFPTSYFWMLYSRFQNSLSDVFYFLS